MKTLLLSATLFLSGAFAAPSPSLSPSTAKLSQSTEAKIVTPVPDTAHLPIPPCLPCTDDLDPNGGAVAEVAHLPIPPCLPCTDDLDPNGGAVAEVAHLPIPPCLPCTDDLDPNGGAVAEVAHLPIPPCLPCTDDLDPNGRGHRIANGNPSTAAFFGYQS